MCLFTFVSKAQISGVVYRDYNGNGTRQLVAPTIEPGLSGVTIQAFNASNVLVSITVSAADGSYSLPFTVPVRVECVLPNVGNCVNSSLDAQGALNDGNNIRFVTSSTSNINFAILHAADFVSNSNPLLFVPQFTNGDPLGGGSAGTARVYAGVNYTQSGTSAPAMTLSGVNIGSVWGNVYSKQAKKIFTTAFVKRHAGLGPMGSGGIYMLTPTPNSFTVTQFYDMDASANVGQYRTRAGSGAPNYGNGTSFSINGSGSIATYLGAIDNVSGAPIGMGVIGENGSLGRNLPADRTISNNDPGAFDQVGKVGLGGIDISDDGRFLFIMNLYDRKLYRLELNNAYNPSSVISVSSYSLPSIAVTNGVLRGFAVKFSRNQVFVGAVSTGENGGVNTVGGTTNLFAYVFELTNPNLNTAAFNPAPILTQALNYTKGAALANGATPYCTQWYPWTNNTQALSTPAFSESCYPTPMLTDIEFSDRGDMILDFTDRSAHQWGYFNYRDLVGTTLVNFDLGGDILIAGKNCATGTYTMESNGSFNSNGTTLTGRLNNNQGLGGGEFFHKDTFPGFHFETSQGSVAVLRGASEAVFTLMDPIDDFSAGKAHMSTINGSRSLELQLYRNTTPTGDFSKANGLGDIEIAGDEPDIQLGNRVWLDANGNGIQDVGENGLAGIQLELFADFDSNGIPDGAALANTITIIDGLYSFSANNVTDGDPTLSGNQLGPQPQKTYLIRIANSHWSGGIGIGSLVGLIISQPNVADNIRDNDAALINGFPQIQAQTSLFGEHKQNFDFGFKPCIANAGNAITLTCTNPSGQLGVTPILGESYSWSPAIGLSQTNSSIVSVNALNTTVYTITVSGTCSQTVLVNVDKTPPIANAGSNASLNCTTPSATIGTAALVGNTYTWSPATNLNSTNVAQPTTSANTTTNYTVTVTNTNGCTATSSVLVGVNKTPPTANAGSNLSLDCTTPSATIGTTALAGNTYAWSPATNLSSSSTAQPTTSANTTTNYTITVTNTNGCTATSTVLVGVNKTPPTANAGSNVSLDCTTPSANIGTAALVGNTYAWSPATNLSSTTVAQPTTSALTTTNYTVTVTNTNGCSATSSVLVGVNKTPPTSNAGSNVSLNCTTPSATIGTTALVGNTYTWSPATNLNSTTVAQPTTSANTTTNYTVTVTNTNGCTATSSVLVGVNKTTPTANAGPNVSLNCTTPSVTIGSATLVGNTYVWSPATNLSSMTVAQPTTSALTTTNYTVTVTNTNGCSATSTVLVGVNKTPPTSNAGSNVSLNCATPSATIGTTALIGNTYSWSPATNLNSTTIAQPTTSANTTINYTVTVTNTNGCTATSSVLVGVNKTTPTANAGSNVSLNCTTPLATIGTAALVGNTFAWSPATNLNSTTVAQPTTSANTTTNYTVTVTNTNGCTATSTVLVGVNKTPPAANAGSNVSLNCTIPAATIGTTVLAGNTYAWSPATNLSSTTIAQPTTSANTTINYTVTVTNTNGCTATSSVLVGVNKTPPTANAGSNVSLNCTIPSETIGTASLVGNTYAWSPATNLSSTTVAQPTTSALTTTNYTVTVTNTNGCIATSSVLIGVNKTPPTANAGSNVSLNCTTPSATIGTTALAGNTYNWSPGTNLSSTTLAQPTTSANTTTNYIVTVTNTNGCTATSSVLVGVNKTPPTANAGSNVSLDCTTPSANIGTAALVGNTYAWSPATNLSSTTIAQPTTSAATTTNYTVTVTNANGCTATSNVLVGVNKTPPTANAGSNVSLNCTTPSATIGTAALVGNSYAWSPATNLSSTTVAQPITSATTTTNYTVTVTNINGCTATSSVLVGVNKTPPTAIAGSNVSLDCTTPSANIGTAALLGNTYAWSPSTNLSSTTVAQPTTSSNTTTNYTVTVTNTNGCTATSSVLVGVNKTPPTANAGSNVSLNCTTPSATIGTTALAGNTYAWSPATNLSSTTVAQPTTSANTTTNYTVTVTNTNGCTATSNVLVGVNKTPPTANAGSNVSLDCTTPSTTIGATALPGNTYAWSPATNLSSTSIAQPTTSANTTTNYTVTVTNTNGCTATSTVLVGVNKTPPTANAGSNVSLNCTTPSATIGTATLVGNTFAWSPATNLSSTTIAQPTTSALTTTNYTVTATNTNGCTATSNVLVGVNKTPPTVITNLNDTICVGSSIVLNASGASTITWNDGINTFPNGSQLTPTNSTTYSVVGTNANGCSATNTKQVHVRALPMIQVQANPSQICLGKSSLLTASGGLTYSWNNGPQTSTQIVSPITNSIYTVVANDGFCSNFTTVSVQVNLPSNQLPPTSTNVTQIQNDGTSLQYVDTNCNAMVSISDSLNGTVLGSTQVFVTLDTVIILIANKPYAKRWYTISPTNNGPASVTLYFTQQDFNDYNSNNQAFVNLPLSGNNSDPNINNIRITKVNGGPLGIGTETILIPTSYWNGNYWEVTFEVQSFSQFYLHTIDQNTALPVDELTATIAYMTDASNVQVNWLTQNETNTAVFEIERSLNAIDFIKVGEQQASGTTHGITHYQYIDQVDTLSASNVLYYRIKLRDIDERVTYSNTVRVRKVQLEAESMLVYPTPFTDQLFIDYNASEDTDFDITLMDASGRIVLHQVATIQKGPNHIQIPQLQSLSNGSYYLSIMDVLNGQRFTKRIVK